MSEQLVRPTDFADEQPPERIIGNETEYDARHPDGSQDNDWPEYLFREDNLAAAGLVAHAPNHGHYQWLSNGAMVYPDVGHLEYATPESLGPLEAAATLHAGNLVLNQLVTASGHPTKIFRRSATVNPETGAVVTKGAHESYCIPVSIATAASMQPIESHLASRGIYVGNGLVTKQGFNIAPKAFDIGSPITESLGSRVSRGSKPFAIVRTALNNNDSDTNLAVHGFGRLETRTGTPGSLWSDFMSMATTSVLLRVIEHAAMLPLEMQALQRLQMTNSVKALKLFSTDMTFRQTTRMADGRQLTSLDIQERLLELGETVMKQLDLPDSEQLAVREWRKIVDHLRQIQTGQAGFDLVADRIGWASKYTRLDTRLGTEAVARGDIKALSYCLAWDRIVPTGGGQIYDGKYGYQLSSDNYVQRFVTQAPAGTRAQVRSQYILNHGTEYSTLGGMRWPFVDLLRYDDRSRRVTLHPYESTAPRLGRKDNRW